VLKGRRVELRDAFIELLQREGRSSVLDLGAGPGGDGQGFIDGGVRYVGIDLAHGNGVLAAESGIAVVQGSVSTPPIRPRSFDAGWSMSTLMHVPEDEVPGLLVGMTIPLADGAPLNVGLWGGDRRDITDGDQRNGHGRLFSHRPAGRNAELLSACGEVEHSEVCDVGPEGWEYQVSRLRVSTA
jgi:hypothetical protein